MMIVLSVAKIAAAVVLVLALLAAAVLLVPVIYTFDGDIDQGIYTLRVHWFFRLVRFCLRYEEKMEAVLRILFFQRDFTDPGETKKRARRREKRAERKKKRKAAKRARRLRKSEHRRENNRRGECTDGIDVSREGQMTSGEDSAPSASGSGGEAGGGRGQKLRKILSIWKAASADQVFEAVLPRLQRLLLRIRPRQLRGRLEFGFQDPSHTGQVLAAASSAFPFLFGTELFIYPDFETEKTYVRGTVHLRGRILGVHLAIFLIRMISDRRVRVFLSALRKKK